MLFFTLNHLFRLGIIFFSFSIHSLTYAQHNLIITEVMRNPSFVTDANGEWFEVYNPTDSPIDINQWTISDNGTNQRTINNGGPLIVSSKGYLVLGINPETSTNGGVDIAYDYGSSSTFALGNTTDEIVIRDTNENLIDSIAWDNGVAWPDPDGASMALKDIELNNNNGENWCVSSTIYGDGDMGTPAKKNDCSTTITAINQDKPFENSNIYPNPTTGIFQIKNTKALITAKLYNSRGQLILSKNFVNDKYKIDISKFKKGIYFLKAETKKSFNIYTISKI